MSRKRRTFSAEFKLDAIKLTMDSGNIELTARNLGVSSSALHRWIREHKQQESHGRPAFTGRGHQALNEKDQEIQQLRKELEITRQERDILKKAVACLDPQMHLTGGVASSPRTPSEI